MKLALVLSVVVSCAPSQSPPPATPAAEMPPLPPAVRVANTTSVAFAADEAARVEEATGTFELTDRHDRVVSGATYRTLCSETPCQANLAPGMHRLRVTSLADDEHLGTDTVSVPAAPSLDYRMNLGRIQPNNTGLTTLTIGLTAAVVGAATMAGSRGIGGEEDGSEHAFGVGLLIGGLAIAAAGAWLHFDRVFQPASSVQWTPSDR